jgi:hypothetical protein
MGLWKDGAHFGFQSFGDPGCGLAGRIVGSASPLTSVSVFSKAQSSVLPLAMSQEADTQM